MPTDDPGDLPKRMATGLREAIDYELTTGGESGLRELVVSLDDPGSSALVAAVMGVRDGLVAHLAARAAKAETRVEHAEAGAQLSSERLAKVRQELDRLWSPAPDSAGRHAVHCEWGATSGAYCSCVGLVEIARLRAERDRLRALVEGQQKTIRDEIAARGQVEAERDALLDIKTTTTPAREKA
jgi:hypothetical protein